ncbi:hypothetical protein ACT7DH_11000 [Bacillus pacificus]
MELTRDLAGRFQQTLP